MKIAIFHNFLDNIGGAEKLDLILAKELNADIYTTNIDKEKINKMGFSADNIFSIGKIPINAPYKQELAFRKFKKINLGTKYDFYIIAGDWALSAARNNKPNLWYVHSPIREIWDLYQYTRTNTVPYYLRPPFDLWVNYHRKQNKKYVAEVDKIISNSNNVKNRINMYLNCDSLVIHPPTDIKKYYHHNHCNFWLSVNRLISHKKIEMQIDAFKKLPNEKLIIVGSYEQSKHFKKYSQYIKSIKPKNVEIISWVSDDRLRELYANCIGFITTSLNEDYGMNVVEAMASGKPVIAPNQGGYQETIINNKTGLLIDNLDENKLIAAVKTISNNPNKFKEDCFAQAKNFDLSIFINKMKKEIGL